MLLVLDVGNTNVTLGLVHGESIMASRRAATRRSETADELELLRKCGCDFGQGYLFSRPVPAEEFEKLVFQQDGRLNFETPAGIT